MASLRKCLLLLGAAASLISPGLAQDAEQVPTESDFSAQQVENGDALAQLQQLAQTSSNSITKRSGAKRTDGCSPWNIKTRREWRFLSTSQRKKYIAAVQCLQKKPSLLAGQFGAAKSMYDDFVITHLMQTMNIHLSGTFLIWHRYFTWTFGERLRTECGYDDEVPYWEWGLDVNNPAGSPVFDGSDTSLGGDGEKIDHPGLVLTEPFNETALIPLPPGTGGGCVKTGPFKDMRVHVGPVALFNYGSSTNISSSANPLDDHDRCLKRDLNPGIAKRFTSFFNSTSLILQNHDVERFQAIMQADPRYVHGELGVHGGGHFTIGGDPGGDAFISPGDPAFFVHHSQVDRLYWIWQMLDFKHRQTVFGTETFLNQPPSADVTLDTVIDISPLAPPRTIRELMSTVGGTPFCYIYL